jgi:hypothetical protein
MLDYTIDPDQVGEDQWLAADEHFHLAHQPAQRATLRSADGSPMQNRCAELRHQVHSC